ncbi:MAG: 16S rRNA (adenine(1518)-N(6)/adenine(1519)-N(6))-dimethyltransferase RsmA [Pseudomonadota bacterium]
MIRARKRFGQHFLHDQGILRRIVDAVNPQPGQHVVEIGPGSGALTAHLLDRVESMDVVEIDRDLAAALQTRWSSQLRIHPGDALKFDLTALSNQAGGPLRLVGNLPYNISTPLLFHFLKHRQCISDMHVMLQKEVIDRMSAAPGADDYGRLTVMLAPWLLVEKLFDVGPGAFTPAPRVWSAVARLTVLSQPKFIAGPQYASIVAQAFMQRRKTLRNSLKGRIPEGGWQTAGVDPGARPETLGPEQFAALAELAAPGQL